MSGEVNNIFSLSPCRIRVPHFQLAFSLSQSGPVCQPRSGEMLPPHHLDPCRSCFLIETNNTIMRRSLLYILGKGLGCILTEFELLLPFLLLLVLLSL